MEETKKCKYCQSDIPKKAKVCPNCKRKQKGKGGIIAIIIIVFIIIIAIATSGGDNDSKKSSDSSSKDTTKQEENTETDDANVITTGKSFEAQGLKVTVDDVNTAYEVQDNSYGLYDLDEGKKYVSATFTFENTGNSDAYVSIYDFDCYADNTVCEQQYLPEGGDFVNTNLSSGRTVSFTTYYAVPADATDIELEYTANVWTSEKVIIKLQ